MVARGRRLAGASIAIVALALAACSKSSNPPVTSASATPTAFSTAVASASPGPASNGIAYVPDAGSGSSVQVVHVEDVNGNLLPSPSPLPMTVSFPASVGPFVSAVDGSVALAVLKKPGAGYSLVQSVLGVGTGSIVPVGSTYDASQLPTPTPSTSPSPGATATPVPSPLPVISDITGASILGTGSNSVGLLIGPSTQGFLGITSLAFAPPQFGGFAPFQGSTQTVTVASSPRTNIEAVLDTAGVYSALVRGPADLIALQISLVGSGYQFNISADDTTLGYAGSQLRGYGAFAIDPNDATKAVVGQGTGGNANQLTLVTGLPTTIARSSVISLNSAINSVTVAGTGTYALVGAANGFYIVGGITSSSLAVVAPTLSGLANPNDSSAYAIPFIGCDGAMHRLTNVTSIDLTYDSKFLVALGSGGQSCSSGKNSTLVAVPVDLTNGVVATPSPAPTASGSATTPPSQFTQNNIVTPPTGVDYMAVH
jgi:hypothetical protein